MAYDDKHHRFYDLIAKTLSTLGIAHQVERHPLGPGRNDNVRVSRSVMRDPLEVVLELQKACGASVVVYWNPTSEMVCVYDAR